MSNLNLGDRYDDQMTPLMLRHQVLHAIADEGDDQSGWVIVPFCGKYMLQRWGNLVVTEMQAVYAAQLVRALRAEAHLDGRWVVVWANPAPDTRIASVLYALFKDRDGDAPFFVSWDDRIEDLVAGDMQAVIWQCAQAHRDYYARLRAVGIRPGQMRKLAQGQRFADEHLTGGKVDPIIVQAPPRALVE